MDELSEYVTITVTEQLTYMRTVRRDVLAEIVGVKPVELDTRAGNDATWDWFTSDDNVADWVRDGSTGADDLGITVTATPQTWAPADAIPMRLR